MTGLRRVCGCAALALVYLIAAELAREFRLDPANFAPFVWPPIGIALAAFVVYGPWLWPGVAVASTIGGILHGNTPQGITIVMSVSVLETLFGRWLLLKVARFRTALDRIRDVLALAGVSLFVSFLGAIAITLGLLMIGRVPPHRADELFPRWWWGHAGGMFLMAPLILTWTTKSRDRSKRATPLEIAALLAAMGAVASIMFGRWLPTWLPSSQAPYYLLPLLAWAGLRFGPRGAATASFGLCTAALVGTSLDRGPFDAYSDLQGFISIATVTSLVLSAAASEKVRAVKWSVAVQAATLDAVVTTDVRGRILGFNPAAERLFCRRSSQVVGDDIAILIPPGRRELIRFALEAYRRGATNILSGRRYRMAGLRSDGTEVPVEVAIADGTFDGESVITGFVRDVTAEVREEHIREQVHEHLEEKVKERTAELMRTNRELERGEALLRQAEELAHLGSFEFDVSTGQVAWSEEQFHIFGRDPSSFTPSYAGFIESIHPDDREQVRAVVDAAIHAGTSFGIEERVVRPDGVTRLVVSRANVLFDGDSPSRVIGCCQDVTEQRELENARYRLADIADSSEDAIIGLSVSGDIESWNAGATRIFGYGRDEVLGKSCTMLVPEASGPALRRTLALAARGEHLPHYEMPHRRKNGTVFEASVTASATRDRAGRMIGLAKVLRDITQRKQFEKQLQVSLREKEVLLREIHHRVKNNLQVISSLLNLQVSTEQSDKVRKGLIENQSRVRSMALVHELLYQSPELGRIDFTAYLNTLSNRLLRTYNVGSTRISLVVEGPAVQLEIDRAIPCGLIVNELVANAIDHAFPAPRKGRIRISITPRPDNQVEIVVADNGIGIPPEITFDTASSFGLRIANTLTRQIHGSIAIERGEESVVRIVFPQYSIHHEREAA
jgi:PAS domain S-box-containing protein